MKPERKMDAQAAAKALARPDLAIREIVIAVARDAISRVAAAYGHDADALHARFVDEIVRGYVHTPQADVCTHITTRGSPCERRVVPGRSVCGIHNKPDKTGSPCIAKTHNKPCARPTYADGGGYCRFHQPLRIEAEARRARVAAYAATLQ